MIASKLADTALITSEQGAPAGVREEGRDRHHTAQCPSASRRRTSRGHAGTTPPPLRHLFRRARGRGNGRRGPTPLNAEHGRLSGRVRCTVDASDDDDDYAAVAQEQVPVRSYRGLEDGEGEGLRGGRERGVSACAYSF